MSDEVLPGSEDTSRGFEGPIAPSPPPPGSRTARISGLCHGRVPVAAGVRLHYMVAGEGEPVVLLPGHPQSWYTWRAMIPLLAEAGRRVYAIDPRGFGDSDIPPSGYDLETGADDLHAYITQLGLSEPGGIDIVSHDIGSWIAHAHAVKYPGDVRRLVLSDAYIPGVSPPPSGWLPGHEHDSPAVAFLLQPRRGTARGADPRP